MITIEDAQFLMKKYPIYKIMNSPSFSAGPTLAWILFTQDQLLQEIKGLRADLKENNKQRTKDIE